MVSVQPGHLHAGDCCGAAKLPPKGGCPLLAGSRLPSAQQPGLELLPGCLLRSLGTRRLLAVYWTFPQDAINYPCLSLSFLLALLSKACFYLVGAALPLVSQPNSEKPSYPVRIKLPEIKSGELLEGNNLKRCKMVT